MNQLNSIYQQNFPLKTKTLANKKVLNPWMTDNISRLIKYKSQYFNLLRMNIITMEENRIFRNKVNSIIRKAKNSYYRNKFNSCQSDIKKTWSLINDILSPNRKKSNDIRLSVGTEEISNHSDLCEIFNTYFSNAASSLSSNLSYNSLNAIDLVPHSSVNFFLFPVDFPECSNIIRDLKNSKTSINELPVKIFKFNECIITPVITKLINRCFNDAVFPDCLKIATILPVFKKGDPKNMKNYRPISILPYMSKIFEKCLYNRLFYFFTSNNLISKNQFGFLPRKSTLDALQKFIEYQYKSLNSNHFSINVFIDLSKAFDTINHEILLGKLYKYGIRGHALELIRSYISDRNYRVKIGDSFSSVNVSNIGTAQGSVLAPLFFLIYVNDMPKFVDKSYPILYADDTTLCFKNNSLQTAINQCNIELSKFSKWCTANKFTINLDKTCFMVVSNRYVPDLDQTIKIDSSFIKCVDSYKFLGVNIDKNLKFNNHISDISCKISKSVGILYRLSNYLPSVTLLQIYNSLVHSHFMYCNAIWGGTNAVHINPLILLQKKCLRIVNKTSYLEHTHPLFVSSKVLKITDIHKYSQAYFIHENLEEIESFTSSHSHNTRQNALNPNFQRLALSQRSIFYSGITYWNSLPLHIRNIDEINSFKKNLKKFILESYT